MCDTPRPPAPENSGAPFDAYYFQHCCGEPYTRDERLMTFFGGIADRVVGTIQPRRVLDAGCALGLLVETLRDRDVHAEGIDLSAFAIANVYEPVRPFCRLGSITAEFPEEYDLIVSIEVLEHMPALDGDAAIANICRHTDDVLFSSSPLDHREPTHVNVQPPEYWAEAFARHGFYRDVDFDASFITPWAVRFRRSSEPVTRIIRHYERRYWAVTVEGNDRRQFAVDLQHRAAQLEAELDQLRQERGHWTEDIDRVRAAHAATQQALADRDALLTGELQKAASDISRLSHDLAQARDTVHHMERSIFWRVRNVLTALRGKG